MLDFLNKAGISEETIKYMNENFSGNDKIALFDNQKECLKTILLLKNLKIINIEDLLRYEAYIFLKSSDDIYYKLSKNDLTKVVEEINNDYAIIEEYI